MASKRMNPAMEQKVRLAIEEFVYWRNHPLVNPTVVVSDVVTNPDTAVKILDKAVVEYTEHVEEICKELKIDFERFTDFID